MSPKPDTWMICPDTAYDHYQCGLASSRNRYRFGEAEKHFRRALELAEQTGSDAADIIIAYAALLERMDRPREAVALYERRLALKPHPNEDRLERRCTAEHLAELKARLVSSES